MDQLKEIKKLIFERKEKIYNIKELIKEEIDRDYNLNLWELSQRELDSEMGIKLSLLNNEADIRDKVEINPGLGLKGKLYFRLKSIFSGILLKSITPVINRQVSYNGQSIDLHLASYIKIKNVEDNFILLNERVKQLEEENCEILEKLNYLIETDKKRS